ncbi:MAG: NAD-dependent epimerase/dehydratase family protein [Bacteroidetes bacterium]|nr:NAD-dependent epimerase/dehydratase family protein [Bacteroidota bacterium]
MNVLVTGGTGFVGQHVVSALLDAGHAVRCLVRSSAPSLPSSVEQVQGDVLKPGSLHAAVNGVDAVVHLVGIIEEFPKRGITFDALHRQATANMVDAARKAGVGRWVQMSANGARKDGVSGYQTSKWAAEQIVAGAGFEHWTILRPSLVFGAPASDVPEFATQLVRDLIRPFPSWPVFGDGSYAMQPIHVRDVAQAFASAVTLEAAHEKTWCLAGREALPFTEILKRIASGAGIRHKPMIFQPLWMMRPIVGLLGGIVLPISTDQLAMLVEGNTCDARNAVEAFGLELLPFNQKNLSYLAQSA